MPRRTRTPARSAVPWSDGVLMLWKDRSSGVSNSEAIYTALRRAIIDGVIPAGERLGENQLASLFRCSRTPVREAIFRLESERLAEYLPRQGLVVATIGREEIMEVYAVRAVLDGLAARLAAEGVPAAEFEQLVWLNERIRQLTEQGDFDNLLTLNFEFHEAICHAGRNAVLLHMLKQVNDRLRRFRSSVLRFPGRGLEAVEEHAAVLEAIRLRDADAAERLARVHMVRAMQVRIAMQQSAYAAAAPLINGRELRVARG